MPESTDASPDAPASGFMPESIDASPDAPASNSMPESIDASPDSPPSGSSSDASYPASPASDASPTSPACPVSLMSAASTESIDTGAEHETAQAQMPIANRVAMIWCLPSSVSYNGASSRLSIVDTMSVSHSPARAVNPHPRNSPKAQQYRMLTRCSDVEASLLPHPSPPLLLGRSQ